MLLLSSKRDYSYRVHAKKWLTHCNSTDRWGFVSEIFSILFATKKLRSIDCSVETGVDWHWYVELSLIHI